MILFYVNSANPEYARIIKNLFRSYTKEKQIQATHRFDPNNPLHEKADIFVFAGMLRGDGLIYKYCKENNKNFLYLDHAYIDRGYKPTKSEFEWMRITYNAFTWSHYQIENNDRWQKNFEEKYPLTPWNSNDGDRILVLPPSEATKFVFPESEEWMKQTLDALKQKTKLPIYIREKPDQPIVDSRNQVIDRKKFNHGTSIDEDMAKAKLIVTFNSAVPVLGTIKGIPCYCSSHAAAYPISINLDQLDNPPEPKRREWLDQLVYHQYTSFEMKTGKVWDLLEKYIG